MEGRGTNILGRVKSMGDAIEEAANFERLRGSKTPYEKPAEYKRPRVERCSALDLQKMEFPPVKWAVPGILPAGCNVLSGPPKKGKSVLMLTVCIAVAMGGYVLGKIKVKQGRAMYFALEDYRRRVKTRLEKMIVSGPWPENLEIITEFPHEDNGGFEQLERELRAADGLRIAVIDTFTKIRSIANNRSTPQYQVDYAAVDKYQGLANRLGICLVLVTHNRKLQGDDPAENVSGTYGITGAADNLMIMAPCDKGMGLYIRGRDVEFQDYIIKPDPETLSWSIMGEIDDMQASDEMQLVLNAVKLVGQPLKTGQIQDILRQEYDIDMDLSNLTKKLKKLSINSKIQKVGYGTWKA